MNRQIAFYTEALAAFERGETVPPPPPPEGWGTPDRAVQDIRQHLATIESEGFEDATYGAAHNGYSRGSLEAAAYTRGFERGARRSGR